MKVSDILRIKGNTLYTVEPSEPLIKALKLTDAEIDDLVAFLVTLSAPAQDFRREQTVEPDCD